MRLKPLPPTPCGEADFLRGYGAASIPNTGDKNKPEGAFWVTKDRVLSEPRLQWEPGRLFLGRVDQKMIGIADTRHLVTIAGTAGGKSTCLLIPNLRLYPGSALVIDPKGELAAATAKTRATAFGHAVHVLDPWGVSGEATADYRGAFDPLTELRDDPANLIENSELVADALIIGNEKDPHWTDAARALIRALVLWLVLDPEESGGSIAKLPALIARLAAEAGGKDDGESGLLHDLAAVDPSTLDEDQEAWAIVQSQAAMMLGTGGKERASILSTARTQLVFLDSPSMAAAVASSALVLADLKRRPCTVYLCLPAARMATHSRWLRLVVNMAVAALEREKTEPPHPVLFVLEEFAALGHMRALEQAVAYMRGFHVRLWTVLQDITQLKRHYKEGWETFLGNAGLIQAFSVSDLTTCEYLSKRLGQTTFQITNKQDVGTAQALQGDSGLRREFKTAPLLASDELARKFARKTDGKGNTAGGLALVLGAGAHPFVVDRVHHGELEA
jgi:type IV secretion system protein VirD4